jgi:hypothetical protein
MKLRALFLNAELLGASDWPGRSRPCAASTDSTDLGFSSAVESSEFRKRLSRCPTLSHFLDYSVGKPSAYMRFPKRRLYAKYPSGVQLIFRLRHVLEVFKPVVGFGPIFVVTVTTRGPRPYERRQNQNMNAPVDVATMDRQSDAWVTTSNAWAQDVPKVPRAPGNIPTNHADLPLIRNFISPIRSDDRQPNRFFSHGFYCAT